MSMIDDERQIRTDGEDGGAGGKLSALPAPTPTSAPQDGSRRGAGSGTRPRRGGARAALNRQRELRNGRRTLSPAQETLLALTARLIVHYENLSNRLYFGGELTKEEEPKVALSKLMELGKEIRTNLNLVYGDAAPANAGLGTEDDVSTRADEAGRVTTPTNFFVIDGVTKSVQMMSDEELNLAEQILAKEFEGPESRRSPCPTVGRGARKGMNDQ